MTRYKVNLGVVDFESVNKKMTKSEAIAYAIEGLEINNFYNTIVEKLDNNAIWIEVKK